MITNMDIVFAIVIASAALALLCTIAALVSARAFNRWRVRCLSVEASLAALRRELELMASISMKTGRRVNRMAHEYSGVAERVEQVELRGATQSFDQAIDSARRGADPGKLSQQFGLSRGEADLVTRLHGRKRRA
jgi:Protein of unknown function (DUF2802)